MRLLLDFASKWLILKLSEDLTRTAAQDRGPGLGDKTETAVRAQDLGQASADLHLANAFQPATSIKLQ